MSRIRRRTFASVDDVWAVLADGWSYSSWVVGTWKIRDVDPDWPRAGAKLYHASGIWPATIDDVTTVLRCEPGRRLVLEARGWPIGDARVEITLREDRSGGCRVSMWEDAIRGPVRLIPAPLRVAALLPRNTQTMRRLISLAERESRW